MDYRWNELDNARGYDQAAEHVHPYYREVQQAILDHLPSDAAESGWVVDLGGGSGRLAERILNRWSDVHVCVIDQSQPFLTLAAERLAGFGERARACKPDCRATGSRVCPNRPEPLSACRRSTTWIQPKSGRCMHGRRAAWRLAAY